MAFRWRKKPIDESMVRLEELVNEIKNVLEKVSEHRVQVNVQSLHVDKASLEQLSFRLDSIDIEELSGSLNLGNNFGTNANQMDKDLKVGSAVDEQEKSHESPVRRRGRMERCESGYHVRYDV